MSISAHFVSAIILCKGGDDTVVSYENSDYQNSSLYSSAFEEAVKQAEIRGFQRVMLIGFSDGGSTTLLGLWPENNHLSLPLQLPHVQVYSPSDFDSRNRVLSLCIDSIINSSLN